MKPIFFGLLMICFINIQVNAQIIETLLFIRGVIDIGIEFYKLIDKIVDETPDRVSQILREVDEMSDKIAVMDKKMDIKLDAMLNIIFDNVELAARAELMKAQLCENIDKIDDYFYKSRDYRIDSECGNRTLEKFIHAVLWSQNSLPNLLESTNDLFLPGVQSKGLLTMIHEHEMRNLAHNCDEYSSTQQRMYYTYIQLIVTEIKGQAIHERIYRLQRKYDENGHNYIGEMDYATLRFRKRLEKYQEIFSKYIKSMPRMTRRCDLTSPELDINYIEMKRFSRLSLFTDISTSECPTSTDRSRLASTRNSGIGQCTRLHKSIKTCLPDSSSPREYIWWKTENPGNHYGPDILCKRTGVVQGESRTVQLQYGQGNVCACSEDRNNVMKISVTEQLSNIAKNMVVTGVKFVMLENVLHLQIQQAKFSHEGLIHEGAEWKDVNLLEYEGEEPKKLESEFLTSTHKAIHLDDIAVPDGYAVTGVRFRSNSTGFILEVHATLYNFTSGELYSRDNYWLNGLNYQMNPEDNNKERKELTMMKPGDPTTVSSFEYDLESNKLVRFTHSDIEKDAGQTTVPLLDAQPVETRPPFPLGGIGLSFKGKEGFGGYIAPRIFTFDVTNYIKYDEDTSPNLEPLESVEWSGQ